MKRTPNKILYGLQLLALCLSLCGCGENFNLEIFDFPDVDDSVQSGDNTEGTEIQISPTLYDAVYAVSTRGTGPLEVWSKDQEHWTNTTFRTFAFRSGTDLRKGSADYNTKKETEDQCLLFDQPLRIDDTGIAYFYDKNGKKVKKYYKGNRLNRWKFFLFNPDVAPDVELDYTSTSKKVTASLSIDGKNDIMHSFAYHSVEDMRLFEEELAAMPNREGDDVRIFTDKNRNQALVYSGLAGSLGLHPKFTLNHLMSRFDVFVLGGSTDEEGNGDGFLQVVIDGVEVMAPGKVTVDVADDSWEENTYNEAVSAGKLLTPDLSSMKTIGMDVIGHKMTNNSETKKYKPNTDFDELWQQIVDARLYSEDALVHHVYTKDVDVLDTLCRTVMLPPMDSYKLRIQGKFFFCKETNGKLTLTDAEDKEMSLGDTEYDISLPNGEAFKPGMKYNILIRVYGRSRVSVSVSIGMPWLDGGGVRVDED